MFIFSRNYFLLVAQVNFMACLIEFPDYVAPPPPAPDFISEHSKCERWDSCVGIIPHLSFVIIRYLKLKVIFFYSKLPLIVHKYIFGELGSQITYNLEF